MTAKPDKTPDKDHPCQLVVEGKDKHVLIHLLEKHFVSMSIEDHQKPYVHESSGLSKSLSYTKQLLRASPGRYTKIGLVVDADEHLQGRWDSIRTILMNEKIDAPAACPREGWVCDTASGVRVGVWVMPNNSDPGKLENFLETLVPDGDGVWSWAREATAQARVRGATFPEKDRIKAEVHAWLAWQEEPGKPFGTSVKAGYFRHDAPEALLWVAWFRRLFLE